MKIKCQIVRVNNGRYYIVKVYKRFLFLFWKFDYLLQNSDRNSCTKYNDTAAWSSSTAAALGIERYVFDTLKIVKEENTIISEVYNI